MSISINGSTTLVSYSSSIPQQVFISTIYSLTGSNIFVQYKNPLSVNFNTNISISAYATNF